MTLYRVQYWDVAPRRLRDPRFRLGVYPEDTGRRVVLSVTSMERPRIATLPPQHRPSSRVDSERLSSQEGGTFFVRPDYVGLGINREVHPYLHARGTASSVIDLLKAANAFAEHLEKKWPSSLCLVGFSQGGYSTLAAHRARWNRWMTLVFQVVASAPIAGVYNLAERSRFPDFLERDGCIPFGVSGVSGERLLLSLWPSYRVRVCRSLYRTRAHVVQRRTRRMGSWYSSCPSSLERCSARSFSKPTTTSRRRGS